MNERGGDLQIDRSHEVSAEKRRKNTKEGPSEVGRPISGSFLTGRGRSLHYGEGTKGIRHDHQERKGFRERRANARWGELKKEHVRDTGTFRLKEAEKQTGLKPPFTRWGGTADFSDSLDAERVAGFTTGK